MKTGETVTELAFYVSGCCVEEMLFDDGDTFSRCPRCHHHCNWEIEEEISPCEELEHLTATVV